MSTEELEPSVVEHRELNTSKSWRSQVQQLQREAHVFYFIFKHPRSRWYAKAIAACTAGYLFSPIQLIPSFIPVIGFLDDLLIFWVGIKVLKKLTPTSVLLECNDLAMAAERRRKDEIRSTSAVAASVVIIIVWILVACSASILVAIYVIH